MPEVEPTGLKFVGRFAGVVEEESAIVLDYDYRDGSQRAVVNTRKFEYSPYSSRDGSKTPIGEAVESLKEGQLIRLSVFVNARGGQVSYRATALELIESEALLSSASDFG